MPLYDLLGDGQSQSKAVRAGAGVVHTVEPLKQMGQLVRRNGFAGVFHRQHRGFPGGIQCQPNGRVGGGVFHRIIQQDIQQLIQLLPVTGQGHTVLDVILQGMPRFKGNRLKPQGGVGDQIAEIHRGEGGGPAALCPGKRQHILHQRPHPA